MPIYFLPCRLDHSWSKSKNTRQFGDISGGLIELKLRQLIAAKSADQIVVSTDDDVVEEIVGSLREGREKIQLVRRPAKLLEKNSSFESLIDYAASILPEVLIVWTHVTSPFFDENDYDDAVDKFRHETRGGIYDSLVTVKRIHSYLWNCGGSVNHDRQREPWPVANTLEPYYVLNNAAFIIDRSLMRERGDIIGSVPFFYEVGDIKSIDIDSEYDFLAASEMYRLINRVGPQHGFYGSE